jgi:predicted dehydrogenase
MSGTGPRIAVVGYGQIAQKHIAAFRSLGVKIVAAVNRSPEKRLEARQAGIEKTYSDVETMVTRERPDGVLVTTSALSQFEVIRKLLFCDVPMLVEKPPAIHLDDWNVLCERIRSRGLKVMIGLNRRYYSVYHRALARMGGVRAITSVSVEWSEDPQRMLALGHPQEIVAALNFANSIHGLDLVGFFGGSLRNAAVWGRNLDHSGRRFRWQMGVHGTSDRGVRACFESNWDVPGRWRLVVDAADVRMVSAPLESATLFRRDRDPEVIEPAAEDQEFKPGFHSQAAVFLELIRSGAHPTWPAASLDDVTVTMELAEELTRVCQGAGGAAEQPREENAPASRCATLQ